MKTVVSVSLIILGLMLNRTLVSYTNLKLYQPEKKHIPVYIKSLGVEPLLKYNHCADIIKFKDKYVAAWNANEVAKEGVPGQYIYISISDNLKNWSTPVKAFTSEGRAKNPIDIDLQWQPTLINYHQKKIICVWCSTAEESRNTFVSTSKDGIHWTNRKVRKRPSEVCELLNQIRDKPQYCLGFPTNHGFISSKGVIMIPCSIVGHPMMTPYAAVLMSRNGGKSWFWSKAIQAVNWSDLDVDPEKYGGRNRMIVWEPSVFEQSDGRMGCLIRNSSIQAHTEWELEPHHTILYAHSEDHGLTWSKARPVDVEATFTRSLVLSGVNNKRDSEMLSESLLMVINDWWPKIPRPIPLDRYNQTLFISPVPDPDLFLPGPLMQPITGRGFYPNGFIEDNKLYTVYTYNGNIWLTSIDLLPDFSQPFLMIRESRPGLKIEGRMAYFYRPQACISLVLTPTLSKAPRLNLSYRFRVDWYRGNSLPLLTLGGKMEQGVLIRAIYKRESSKDFIQIRYNDRWYDIADFKQGEWINMEILLGENKFMVSVNGQESKVFQGKLMRKIAFGKLYGKPNLEWWKDTAVQVTLNLNSITIK